MNLWTMIFLVITVIVLGDILKSSAKAKGTRIWADDLSRVSQELERLQNKLAGIEKRLENVETITTSKDFDLNREFEELNRS